MSHDPTDPQTCRATGGHFWEAPIPGERNRCERCGYFGGVFERAGAVRFHDAVAPTEGVVVNCSPSRMFDELPNPSPEREALEREIAKHTQAILARVIEAEANDIAETYKAGSPEHRDCDGWRFVSTPRAILFCGCGATLVESTQ
ncbi:hypothetical protein SEA_EVAA_66 [Gordonia phage Evaa]|nr:hypothetical protein SEA_EVAA_66 [Gordonia phage Evaa]